MSEIWFISDTHFGHENMLRFTDTAGKPVRSFSNVQVMDETMIANWNRVVSPNDKVYHLGDVGFSLEHLQKVLPRLHGKKRLLLGNHDRLDVGFYRKHFQKIGMWRHFTDDGAAIICTHCPLHESSFLGRYAGSCLNVHGHIHKRIIPDAKYRNVCVEQINYTPVNYDALISAARRMAT